MTFPNLFLIITGLCAGFIVSGAVFAFIAVIGVVPRLSHRTATSSHVKTYEEAIITGGLLGLLIFLFPNLTFHAPFLLPLLGLLYGIFVGSIAVCLAEILNILPIISRRAGLQRGLPLFVPAFALGKLLGALTYFFVPGFS